MPSSTQTVPTIQVFDYVLNPASTTSAAPTGAVGVRVRATLSYNQSTYSSPVVGLLSTPLPTTTDTNGYWTLYLAANDAINPSGTTWLIQVDGYAPYEINVTSTSVPVGGWQSSTIVVNTPSTLGSTAFQLPDPVTATGVLNVNGNARFHGPNPWFDVTHPSFAGGAVAGTDCTPSLRAAVAAAVAAGGGTIWTPPSSLPYYFQPQSAVDTQAVTVNGSNITFLGAGRGASRWLFGVYPMLAPATNWNLVAAAVLRGDGFALSPGISNIRFKDIELDGGSGYTGDGVFPANPITGDGWDVTNKAIHATDSVGNYVSNITFDNAYIHSWRGELVYAGGSRFLNWQLINGTELYDSNGDLLSVSAAVTIDGTCILHKSASDGIENAVGTPDGNLCLTIIEPGAQIADCDLDGINIRGVNGAAEPYPRWYIRDPIVRNCRRSAIAIGRSTHNIYIEEGTYTDCGQTTLVGGGGNSNGTININPTADQVDNLHIVNPQIICDNSNMNTGVRLVAGSFPIKDVECVGIDAWVTDRAVAGGFAMNSPATVVSGTLTGVVKQGRNYGKGTTFQRSDLAQADDALLTTTGATDVVQLRPTLLTPSGDFIVSGYFRVTVAPTNVTVVITYRDVANSTITVTVLPLTSLAIGAYQIAPVSINAIGSNASAIIKLTITAGTANQVFASGSIVEAFAQ